ncbi:MAG: glycosyltransferase family 9 protein [Candidatus Omnitrophica bacterium]|nr:glycosyltransferase family 9 protein [Candidatus Omnitrophota bacterium]
MKILIINPFGIGDVLFSTPMISNIKMAYPQAYIGYICNIRAKDALYHNPNLNKVFVFEKDEYRKLWRSSKIECIKKFLSFLKEVKIERFDLAIDLSLGYHYSLFLWLIGVKKRIGYNYRRRGRFLTHKIDICGYDDKPVAEYYLDLLRFLDIKPKEHNLKMYVSEKEKKWADSFFQENDLKDDDLVVGMIPAGGASWGKNFSYRHWSCASYARLADKLIDELKAKVVIFGDKTETNICRQVQDATAKKVISLCGKTSLKEFAACLSKCKLVVCNDGGPLHVAVSQDVKTISVFGPVDEQVYGPYPPAGKHIVVSKSIDCRPCYKRFKLPACTFNRRCIRNITVEEVFEKIKNNLPTDGKLDRRT